MKIKTYKGKLVEQPHFFILNKGLNTGSPNFKPYANCFVLTAETMKELNFYYWLCFALWQTERFIPSLSGSVIPFIKVKDLRNIIADAEVKVNQKEQEYKQFLSLLIEIDTLNEQLAEQQKLIKAHKKFIFRAMLK